jgi:2-dehydropantoate 2-reductase
MHSTRQFADVAPAIGESSAILPVLNGTRHLDRLRAAFGGTHVLGGVCIVATTLDADDRIVQLSEMQELSDGELDGTLSERVRTRRADVTSRSRCSTNASP